MRTFLELDEGAVRGSVLIVDIDGTLTHDGGEEFDAEVLKKLSALALGAEVYLCSNGPRERTRNLASRAGVSFVDTIHRKPSRRVLEGFLRTGKRLIVLGDKALTDGLFAANIGAEYIPVKRIRHANDSLSTRFIYAVDDMVGYVVRAFFLALPYLILMRPLQWVKNLLVFTPVFFAGTAFIAEDLFAACVAAILFSFVSSATYIFNDIKDVEQDKLHSTKRLRPLATGVISLFEAWLLFSALLIAGVIGIAFIPALAPVLIVYISLNILYSAFLKHVAVAELLLVAVFYVLRVWAGGAAAETYISPWIVSCVFFGALFMIVGKRKAELLQRAKRRVLAFYSDSFLSGLLIASAVLAVSSYSLYAFIGSHSPLVLYSAPLVFLALYRLTTRLLHPGDGEAEYPETLVFKDRVVLGVTFLWVVFMFILLYL